MADRSETTTSMEPPSPYREESFNYMESGKAARTRQGATAAGLAGRNTRLNADQVVSNRPNA